MSNNEFENPENKPQASAAPVPDAAPPKPRDDKKPGWERDVLEKLALFAVKEQRARRRWSVFFRIVILVAIVFGLWLAFTYGKTESEPLGTHTALVEIKGAIDSEGQGSAGVVIPALDKAFAASDSVGVILKIKPTADRNGNIQTLVETEASEIDRSVSIAIGANVSVPGFRTRKVKTNVTVRHGETIVLSGVFQNDEEKDVSKLPGPGNIPLIGEFFKNRTFQGTKRELVIFVTPRIVNPDTERVQKIIEDIKNRYKQARDEVTFSIFD